MFVILNKEVGFQNQAVISQFYILNIYNIFYVGQVNIINQVCFKVVISHQKKKSLTSKCTYNKGLLPSIKASDFIDMFANS